MVECKFLAYEYKASGENERHERDEFILDIVKDLCIRLFRDGAGGETRLIISFFSESYYGKLLEFLKESGFGALYQVEIGVDRIIRITFNDRWNALWRGMIVHR